MADGFAHNTSVPINDIDILLLVNRNARKYSLAYMYVCLNVKIKY